MSCSGQLKTTRVRITKHLGKRSKNNSGLFGNFSQTSDPPLLGTLRSKWNFLGDFVKKEKKNGGDFRVIKGHFFFGFEFWELTPPPPCWEKFPNNPVFFLKASRRSFLLLEYCNAVWYEWEVEDWKICTFGQQVLIIESSKLLQSRLICVESIELHTSHYTHIIISLYFSLHFVILMLHTTLQCNVQTPSQSGDA